MKLFIVILFFTSLVFAQDYKPYIGSMYWAFDLGLGLPFGSLVKNDNQIIDSLQLKKYISKADNADTSQLRYTYSTMQGNLIVGYFATEAISFGVNLQYSLVTHQINMHYQASDYIRCFNLNGIVGYYCKPISQIVIYPMVHFGYSYGYVDQLAGADKIGPRTPQIEKYLQTHDSFKNAKGINAGLGTRFQFFPFSGRFFGFLEGKYNYQYLSTNESIPTMVKVYDCNTIAITAGFGYITK